MIAAGQHHRQRRGGRRADDAIGPEMAAKIFLAHASQDKPQVRKLYADLKKHGFEPWLDEINLVPGQNWKVEIPKVIRQEPVAQSPALVALTVR
jgi:hypothetical protein